MVLSLSKACSGKQRARPNRFNAKRQDQPLIGSATPVTVMQDLHMIIDTECETAKILRRCYTNAGKREKGKAAEGEPKTSDSASLTTRQTIATGNKRTWVYVSVSTAFPRCRLSFLESEREESAITHPSYFPCYFTLHKRSPLRPSPNSHTSLLTQAAMRYQALIVS